jgi:hypothetical protein
MRFENGILPKPEKGLKNAPESLLSTARIVSPLLNLETILALEIPSIFGKEFYILVLNETVIRDCVRVCHQARATLDG